MTAKKTDITLFIQNDEEHKIQQLVLRRAIHDESNNLSKKVIQDSSPQLLNSILNNPFYPFADLRSLNYECDFSHSKNGSNKEYPPYTYVLNEGDLDVVEIETVFSNAVKRSSEPCIVLKAFDPSLVLNSELKLKIPGLKGIVEIEKILYIHKYDDQCCVHYRDYHQRLNLDLDSLLLELPYQNLIRLNDHYVINAKAITGINCMEIYLKASHSVVGIPLRPYSNLSQNFNYLSLSPECIYSHYYAKMDDEGKEWFKKLEKVAERGYRDGVFSVDFVANQLGVSTRHFQRKFKELTDLNPKEFFIEMRMLKAKQLLCEKNMSISEIANNVGYLDVKYFSSLFRKRFGKNPSEIKKKIRKKGLVE